MDHNPNPNPIRANPLVLVTVIAIECAAGYLALSAITGDAHKSAITALVAFIVTSIWSLWVMPFFIRRSKKDE